MTQFLSDTPPDAETIENALIDFGFYHRLSDVCKMYAEYQNHGNYGYTGGVLDQPDEYWHDIETMKWLELWIKHVKSMPRMEQVSVFDTLRESGQFNGSRLIHGTE